MTDNESSLETSLGVLNLLDPLFSPEVLEREKSVTDLVVALHCLLGLLLLDQILRELLHGAGDSEEQVARPGDASRNCGQVSHNRRVVLVTVVLLLNLGDLHSVVVEEESVLRVEAVFEVVSDENSLELAEKLKRVLNRGNVLKVLVNVGLELSLNG